MKVTTRMHNEIVGLHKRGWENLRISKKFGISPSTVSYHLDPDAKEKKREKAKKNREKLRQEGKLKDYYRERNSRRANVIARRRYIKEQYANNPEFKEIQKERARMHSKWCKIKQIKEISGKLISYRDDDHPYLRLSLPGCKETELQLPKSWIKFFNMETCETEVEVLIRKKAKAVGG